MAGLSGTRGVHSGWEGEQTSEFDDADVDAVIPQRLGLVPQPHHQLLICQVIEIHLHPHLGFIAKEPDLLAQAILIRRIRRIGAVNVAGPDLQRPSGERFLDVFDQGVES